MVDRSKPLSIMLDSGAYSAWFHGAELELPAYIEYCQSRARLFDSVVALDKIPGSHRKPARSSAEVDAAARQSHLNYLAMRKAGLDPIPVFHQGEDWGWLHQMLKDGATYIGISPYPRASQENILRWLDECFSRLTLESGEPIVKTHGFGATSWGMITRYPWFSIDSTTWALAAGYGTIIVPPMTWDPAAIAFGKVSGFYDRTPLRFSVTDRERAGSRPLMQQGPSVRGMVECFARMAGTDLSEITNSDRYRAQFNAFYYVELERSLGCSPFQFRKPGLPLYWKKKVAFNYQPRVIFAEQIGKDEYSRALWKVGANKRLISYYESRRYSDEQMAVYCSGGLLPKERSRPKKRGSTAWNVRRRLGLIARLKEVHPDE